MSVRRVVARQVRRSGELRQILKKAVRGLSGEQFAKRGRDPRLLNERVQPGGARRDRQLERGVEQHGTPRASPRQKSCPCQTIRDRGRRRIADKVSEVDGANRSGNAS